MSEGVDVTLKGVHFSGGGSAIATTAAKGSLTLVDCGFTDFKGPAIRAESSVPRGFRIRMTGGNSYTAQLYRGNADNVGEELLYFLLRAAHLQRERSAVKRRACDVFRLFVGNYRARVYDDDTVAYRLHL